MLLLKEDIQGRRAVAGQPVQPGSFIDRRQEDAADARRRRSSRCSDHFTELSRQPRAAKSSRRLYQEPQLRGFVRVVWVPGSRIDLDIDRVPMDGAVRHDRRTQQRKIRFRVIVCARAEMHTV